MKRMRSVLMAAVLGMVLQPNAPTAQMRSELALREAMEQETVTGDVKGAIERYKAIIAAHAADRAVVAKALVRLAECYQRVGDDQARKTFERVVREYADQKEAAGSAQARLARLASLPAPTSAAQVHRLLWTMPDQASVYARVSRDGRFLPYADFVTGALFLRDLGAGTARRVANATAPEGGSGEAALSRDGKQLAYRWWRGTTGASELRVVSLLGAEVPKPRVLVKSDEVRSITPYDWSPDGKFVAVQLTRPDMTTQIALVAAHTGSIRVLKSVDWRGSSSMSFSPDGRYLGYDLVTTGGSARDIFVLAADGSTETAVVPSSTDDVFVDWSPDGTQVLFASDRTGSWNIWAVPVAAGEVSGDAQLMTRDTGPVTPLGLTSAGNLYTLRNIGLTSEIKTATFDFANGALSSAPVLSAPELGVGLAADGWSPDGQRIAYRLRADRPGLAATRLRILTVTTGESRVFPLPLAPVFGVLQWSSDSSFLLAAGIDADRRAGIFKIDVATGAMSTLVTAGAPGAVRLLLGNPSLSPDGSKLYFRRDPGRQTDAPLVERDLTTGQERLMFEAKGRVTDIRLAADRKRIYYVQLLPSGQGPPQERVLMTRDLISGADRELARGRTLQAVLSPDERHIAVSVSRPATADGHVLLLIPTDGGAPREVMRVRADESILVATWAPDSESMIVQTVAGPVPWVRGDLWWVRRSSLEARRIGGAPVNVSASSFAVHPDGKQIVFQSTAPTQPAEVWVLENSLSRRPAQ